MFFRRARELRWIPENPAELLLAVQTPSIEVKKKTPEEKQQLLDAILRVRPSERRHGTERDSYNLDRGRGIIYRNSTLWEIDVCRRLYKHAWGFS
jgi:hypothetical protein